MRDIGVARSLGPRRADEDTNGDLSIMDSTLYADCVLWQAFSYSDNSDADFYDLSTSGNDGSQGTAAAQPSHQTALGGYYDFDGVDDVIVVPDSASLRVSNNLSMAMWVNPDTASGDVAAGKDDLTLGRDYSFQINTLDLRVIITQDGTYTAGNRLDVRTTGSRVPTNVWTHCAFTFASGTIVLYVNGKELTQDVVQDDGIGYVNASSAQFTLGARSNNGAAQNFYDGALADGRVFDATLTSNEVYTIWNDTKSTYGL